MAKDTPYINSGVLLMNLDLLRRELDPESIYAYIRKHRKRLMLPDQDILSALFGSKTLLLDSLKYNLSEKYQTAFNFRSFPGESKINLDWIRKNTVIVHYCGRNKPWKANYVGELNCFYREISDQLRF
jgi:lipopolysaccharide biosynthesis glycosyltransferase